MKIKVKGWVVLGMIAISSLISELRLDEIDSADILSIVSLIVNSFT